MVSRCFKLLMLSYHVKIMPTSQSFHGSSCESVCQNQVLYEIKKYPDQNLESSILSFPKHSSLGIQAVMFSLGPHDTGAFTERAPSRQQAQIRTHRIVIWRSGLNFKERRTAKAVRKKAAKLEKKARSLFCRLDYVKIINCREPVRDGNEMSCAGHNIIILPTLSQMSTVHSKTCFIKSSSNLSSNFM